MSLTTYSQIVFVLAMSQRSSATSVKKLLDECDDCLESIITLVEEVNPNEFLTVDGLVAVRAFLLLFPLLLSVS